MAIIANNVNTDNNNYDYNNDNDNRNVNNIYTNKKHHLNPDAIISLVKTRFIFALLSLSLFLDLCSRIGLIIIF